MPCLERKLIKDYRSPSIVQGISGRLRIFKVGLGSDLNGARPESAAEASPAHSALLNNGCSIPLVGLGTWKSDKGQVSLAVSAALEAGYRHLDCAAVYENEHEVGAALQQAFASKVVQRHEVFVTSKLWLVSRNTGVVSVCVSRVAHSSLSHMSAIWHQEHTSPS